MNTMPPGRIHRRVWNACLVGALLFPALMTAQIDRSRPPVAGPAPEVRIGEPLTAELPNGMRLIVVEDHKVPLVSVQLRFDVPPIQQGEQAGYVELFGELLTAGAGQLAKADIDRTVDALGASFFAGNDGLFASGLKRNLEPLMELMSNVARNPSFPQEELDKARLRARSSVQQRHEDPEAIAESVGRALMFGRNHPYGEVTTEKTLARVDRDRLVAYHRHFFRPEKAFLVFVGDISMKEAKDLAREHFGKWAPPHSLVSKDDLGRTLVEGLGAVMPLESPTTPSGLRRVFMVDRPGAAQSVVRVLFPLPLKPKDLRAQQAQVMNTILGGGIFNARLMQNLREKKGFTYGCYASLDVDRFNSGFMVSTSVRTEVTDSAVLEIVGEIERMRNEPVSTDELELAKRSMMGSFGRSLEDPRTVARFALNVRLNDLSPDHYRTYLQRLETITPQHVMEAAGAFLYPDQAIVLVVGDMERVQAGLRRVSLEVGSPVVRLTEEGTLWEEVITPVTDRTASQVIETYIHAIGGREKIAPLRHLELVRTIQREDGSSIRTEWFAPDQYRTRLMAGPELVEEIIFDGKRVLYTDAQASGELTDAGFEAVRLQAHPIPELAYDKLLERLTLLGTTTLGDSAVYKLRMNTNAGTSFQAYFDVRSGLKVRQVEDQLYNGHAYHKVTDYGDWRPVNGVLFPFVAQETGGVSGDATHTITAVRANQPMPPGHFDVNIPEVPEEPFDPSLVPPDSSVPVGEE